MGITFQLMRVITTVIPSKNPQLQPLVVRSFTSSHIFPMQIATTGRTLTIFGHTQMVDLIVPSEIG